MDMCYGQQNFFQNIKNEVGEYMNCGKSED